MKRRDHWPLFFYKSTTIKTSPPVFLYFFPSPALNGHRPKTKPKTVFFTIIDSKGQRNSRRKGIFFSSRRPFQYRNDLFVSFLYPFFSCGSISCPRHCAPDLEHCRSSPIGLSNSVLFISTACLISTTCWFQRIYNKSRCEKSFLALICQRGDDQREREKRHHYPVEW